MTTMTTVGLKELYTAYIEEMWDRKDLSRATNWFAEDIVDHSAPPGQGSGLAGLLAIFRMMHAAFPDWKVRIELQLEENDLLVSRIATSGTHTGTFFGIPATGRTFQSTSIHILRYSDGKMIEHWSNGDDLGMMVQLGVIQMPGM
jgi:steroid delta-isomerase-like uncharacterized protein